MQNDRLRTWAKILTPVIVYQALLIGLRAALTGGAKLPGGTAAAVATAIVFLPAALLYLYKWRSECALPVESGAERTENGGAPAKRRNLRPVWILAAFLMAAAAIGCPGAQNAAGTGDQTVLIFTATCLLGPFTEEVLYRGQLIGRGLTAIGDLPLLLVSALLFAAGHGSMAQCLIALPAGLLLGALYLRERSLTGVTAAHGAANILIFCASNDACRMAAGRVIPAAALLCELALAALLAKPVLAGRTDKNRI